MLDRKEPLANAVKQCNSCIHRVEYSSKCAAFPKGIPDEILLGDFDHQNPYPGDNGIRFEPIKEEE